MEQKTNAFNVEKLEIEKEDTEQVLKKLNSTALKFEEFSKDNAVSEEVKIIFNKSLKEINNEIEWREMILQELDDSINFVLNKV